MAISWYAGYGGYNNTGPYANVLLMGSPTNAINGLSNIQLDEARRNGKGRGVGFELVSENNLKIHLSLVAVMVSDSGVAGYNANYVNFGGTYFYYIKISKSTNGGRSFDQIYLGKDIGHPSTNPLAYNPNWHLSSNELTYDVKMGEDVTNIKVEIYGEDATFPHENIFTREQVIKDSWKPWGVRKGTWKSLTAGWFKKRTSGSWQEKGQINQNKIRNSGTRKNQGKLGN